MSGLVPFNTKNSVFNLGGFNNMLDDFFTDSWLPSRSLMRDSFKIDVEENEQELLISAELPGVEKNEISLNVNDNKLTIAVNKTENLEEQKKNYIHRERRISSMTRSVYLADAETDNIKAKLENGILTVFVPKKVKQVNSATISID